MRFVDEGRIELLLSEPVLAEVTEVMNRPELRAKLRSLTPERVQAFLADVVARATTIATVPNTFSYPRDPKDEPYVNLALAAGARYLVAWDKDLLALMNDADPAGRDFRVRFPTLTVLTPPALLGELAAQQPPPESEQRAES
jgi:putative PIN family toxin of toxin-antitoxin system